MSSVTLTKTLTNMPPYSLLEEYILKDCTGKITISGFYNLLTSGSSESSETETSSLERGFYSFTVQLADVHILYITTEKSNKFNSNFPDSCFKCEQCKGTFFTRCVGM